MNDLISRQAAIDAMCEACSDWCDEGVCRKVSAIQKLPPAQPEIIHCRDCKHRPKATRADEKVFHGFSVEFPDEKCPCRCVDGWYNWYPEDDFYCGYAERSEEVAQQNLQLTCNQLATDTISKQED